MALSYSNALGIDVGEKRVGVARVNAIARLPEPLGTYSASGFESTLAKLLDEHDIDCIVVGLPRNMTGQETAQTAAVRSFTAECIEPTIGERPLIFVDETLTSVAAESRASKEQVAKLGIDSFAAAEILDNFARSQG